MTDLEKIYSFRKQLIDKIDSYNDSIDKAMNSGKTEDAITLYWMAYACRDILKTLDSYE